MLLGISSTERPHWSDQYVRARPNIKFNDSTGVEHLLDSSFDDAAAFWARWPIGSQVMIDYNPTDINNCELSLRNLSVAYLFVMGLLAFAFFFSILMSLSLATGLFYE